MAAKKKSEEKRKRWFKVYTVGRSREIESVIHCKTKPITQRMYTQLIRDELRRGRNTFVELDQPGSLQRD